MEKSTTPQYFPESERSKFISLKEAAAIAEYSPDYIGQLIRSGKIEGHQIYTNVSWVTTEEAIRTYMRTKGKVDEEKEKLPFWKDAIFYIRSGLYLAIFLLGCILMVLCYIFFVGIDHAMTNVYLKNFDIHAEF